MTREQRIEAAARATWKHFDRFSPRLRAHALGQAERMMIAAFPELMSDPPTGWLAPMEATEAMGHEMFMHGDDVWTMWAAARDAHSKEQTQPLTPAQ